MRQSLNRRRFLLLSAGLAGGTLLAACGGANPAAQPAGGAASTAASAAAAPASGAPAASLADSIAAAKKEGGLTLITQPDPAYQKLLEVAQKQLPYLKIEHNPFRPTEFMPRILAEQRNGQFLWDLHVGPISGMLSVMTPAGALQPLQPFLDGLPDSVRGDSNWGGGFAIFADPKTPVTLVTQYIQAGGIYVNRDKVPADQFNSSDQLTDARLKGQIILYDPSKDNSTTETLSALFDAKGQDFVKKVLDDQQSVKAGDARQATQWLAEGRYPVAVGPDLNILHDLQSKGLGKNVERMDGDSYYLESQGVSIFKSPTHPNAIKAFLAWFLSQEGQDAYASAIPDGSTRRLDVKVYHAESMPDLKNLASYKHHQGTPEGVNTVKQVIALATGGKPA
jgi:iron(III) transport system substrate-binding protein